MQPEMVAKRSVFIGDAVGEPNSGGLRMFSLSWLTGNWLRLIPWLAGALALAGAYFYVHQTSAKISALEANIAQEQANTETARNAAKVNADALARAQAQSQADLAAVQAHYTDAAKAEKVKTIILETIANAPASDDGPVAPVLAHALDCLRDQARAGAGATGADCQAQAPGSAAGLPASP